MKLRNLGNTGIQVSELSLGGLFISSIGGREFEQSRAATLRALELGVNYIDTAPGYSNSEETLGKALEGVEQPYIISTKLGGRPKPFEPQNKECLRRSLEMSLEALKRDHIDILFVHEPERPGQYDWWSDFENVDGPVLELIDELKAEGLVRFSGVGGTMAWEMERIVRTGKFDVVLTAFNYSLLWREAEWSVIPAAKELGMGIVIGSPLQQGALATRYDDQVDNGAVWMSPPRRNQLKDLYAFLDQIDMSIAELSLRFVLSNPDISCALMGARSVEEVDLNYKAMEAGPLPEDIMKRVNEIAGQLPFRPYGEPAALRFGGGYRGPGGA
ncbi:MAG: aldo/keto reductase [Planctomycetota bacterium]|nr:aldo/keto reductase [Planctomycetota bacterium]MDA1137325.1 aldo/keto reductase [Planctomycetota bacterium]